MRWPWQKETREASGGYTEIIARLVESQAIGSAQQASATAGMEAAAGALSRAFSLAEVVGPQWVKDCVSPATLALIGRDLIRVGESLHVIRMSGGRLCLFPASTWYWEGGVDPHDWLCTATAYGPSGSSTWRVPESSVAFVRWGVPTARPYHGLGPAQWAADSARLHSGAERSLADEAGGPVAQFLPVPQDGGDGEEGDPLAEIKADIGKAKGKPLLVQTTAAGWDEGKGAAPQSDWKQSRLGPMPPEGLVRLADAAFQRMLAACGTPPSIFTDADGTAQREAVRRWHLGTVLPLARLVEHELTAKLETDVRLKFDTYPLDLAGRAQAFQKLVAGGVAVNEALVTAGLLSDGG